MSNTTSTSYPPSYLEANRSRPAVNVAIAFIVIDVVFFALRTWARWIQISRRNTRWMWSDVFMPLSLIFNLAMAALLLICVHYGAGRHEAALTRDQMKSLNKCIWLALPLVYLPTVIWSKFAILDVYLHVFRDKLSYITCWVIAAVISLNCIINIPIVIWQCDPISTPWTMDPKGHCDDASAHYTWVSLPNILTDFIMLVLPIPTILKLNRSIDVKLGIYTTFAIGNLGLATGIVRLIRFYYFGWTEQNPDASWLATRTIPWCVIEPSVYHTAACMISFRPLLQWIQDHNPLSQVIEKVLASTSFSTTSILFQKRVSGNEPARRSSSNTTTATANHLDDSSSGGGNRSSDESFKPETPPDPALLPLDLRPNSSGFITVQRSFQVRRGVVM